jgi:plastocyanin
MRLVTTLSRRRFGMLLASGLAVPAALGPARAHDGPHRVEVDISSFAFSPGTLSIRPGDSVVWTNRDIVPHTATATDGGWDTERIDLGQSAEMRFEAPGRHGYFCAFHPGMTAEIIVRQA